MKRLIFMPEGVKLRGDTGATTDQGDTLKTDETGETPHKLKGAKYHEKSAFTHETTVFRRFGTSS